MSSKLLLLLLVAALPGYHFEFPRDHFNHPDYETEWWYYTGNLRSGNGHRFGYELTFFRQANTAAPPSNSVWRPDQLYLAHLAVSDIDGQTFQHYERLNRAGPGLAGAELAGRKYWNGNWRVQWTSDQGDQQLEAVAPEFTLKLTLLPAKPFVIHGVNGISQKGPAKGEASHYISFTRLASSGTLVRAGRAAAVTGTSWMDHEFFTESEDPELRGWDWFAIQLNNNEELMLYRLRLKSAAISPYSSGTFVDARGQAHHLSAGDFTLTPGANWRSPTSRASYPLAWHLEIPSLAIRLNESTRLNGQELYTPNSISPGYWEGAVDYSGTEREKPVQGVGYLEMTGYLSALRLGH
ncbi:MAG TPA: lipocalin-like domain-containing protein [Bryobacteraceae bacterium]|nr:lipocalin-like domain-containing protein [Bryobacteraceae bacterium]